MLAKSLVEHREQKGLFKSREDLLEVSRFSKKAFEQAAGFLRLPNSENPLDNTGVHPENYSKLQTFASELGKSVKDFIGSGVQLLKAKTELREAIGPYTFDDIVTELAKPGRDPREAFVQFQFLDNIHEVKDLTPGLLCPGIVTNVTNFGAFVDIGVHQDGLVHISQLSDKFVKDPREVVSPGDRVRVKVLEVNVEKNQISLSMKNLGKSGAEKGTSTSSAGSGRSPDRDRDRDRRTTPAAAASGWSKPAGARKPGTAVGSTPSPIQAKPTFQKDAPRPIPAASAGASHRGNRGSGAGPRPKEVFNNAFAGLAALKGSLKPK